MDSSYRIIHKDFHLNGTPYSAEELKVMAYSLVKEGKSFEQPIGNFLMDWLDSKSSIEVNTSGSTGKPKRIELQKHHMVNSAMATGAFFGLAPGSSALLCLPGEFIAGKMMLVRAMVLGLKLDFIKPSSNPLSHNSKAYDFCAMVPLQLENSMNELHKAKTLIVGGAPISEKQKHQIKKQVQSQNTRIFETYGMTETITHVALKQVNTVRPSAVEARGDKQATKLKNTFTALPNVRFSRDERDCLVIEAPKVADAPIITNDVVKLVSDTEFEWLGRYDNVINSGGLKLFPEQIEAKLASIVKSRFFVAGLPDEKLGQKLVLVLEGETDGKLLSRKIVGLSSLNMYEIPKAIHIVPDFLKTETGKIRRKETLALLIG